MSHLLQAQFHFTWGFPIWDVLASVLVSGVVTALTIRWSIRSARKETDRALAQDRAAGRGAAIAALLTSFRLILEQGREEVLYDPTAYPGWAIASSALRLSRAPHVEAVLEWTDQMAWFFEFHGQHSLQFLDGQELSLAEANPSLYVGERLARWDADPDQMGAEMENELTELRAKVWFTAEDA